MKQSERLLKAAEIWRRLSTLSLPLGTRKREAHEKWKPTGLLTCGAFVSTLLGFVVFWGFFIVWFLLQLLALIMSFVIKMPTIFSLGENIKSLLFLIR